MNRPLFLAGIVALGLGFAGALPAQNGDDKKSGSFHKVAKVPFVLRASLDGNVSTSKEHAVILENETWGDYEILEVAEHGTRVKKGDLLIKFDRKPYDRALEELERKVKSSERSLAVTKAGLDRARKEAPLNTAANRRMRDEAIADHQYYRDVDRPQQERNSFYYLKSARQYLAYSEEELKQLLAMYEADDLVEETEEIIVQRARNSVESSKFRVESNELDHERTVGTWLPRRALASELSVKRAEFAFAERKVVGEAELEIKELDYESARVAHGLLKEKLADLRKDARTLSYNAPADGVAVWGKIEGGRWVGLSEMSKKLKIGGKAAPKDHLFTIIAGEPSRLTSTAKVEQLPFITDGARGAVSFPGRSEIALAKVTAIAAVPDSNGSFKIKFEGKFPEDIPPGAKVKVQIPADSKARTVIAIPLAAVGADFEGNKITRYVTMKNGDRRVVELGATVSGKVEIIKGLKVEEEIYAKQE